MKTRTVSHVLYGEIVSMGGMPVRQPFPTQNVEQIDPLITASFIFEGSLLKSKLGYPSID